MDRFDVQFYSLPGGSEPAREFLDSLDKKMRTKLLRSMQLLEQSGNNLREPDSKHLSDGIFELRAKVSSDIARVLYFFMVGKRVIVTHGLIKKTKKTPPPEIERARKYRAEYLSRKEDAK